MIPESQKRQRKHVLHSPLVFISETKKTYDSINSNLEIGNGSPSATTRITTKNKLPPLKEHVSFRGSHRRTVASRTTIVHGAASASDSEQTRFDGHDKNRSERDRDDEDSAVLSHLPDARRTRHITHTSGSVNKPRRRRPLSSSGARW